MQAGAKVVYAVEASGMAHYARQLAAANPGVGVRIRVLHGKVEEVEVPEKVGPGHACVVVGGWVAGWLMGGGGAGGGGRGLGWVGGRAGAWYEGDRGASEGVGRV